MLRNLLKSPSEDIRPLLAPSAFFSTSQQLSAERDVKSSDPEIKPFRRH